MRVRGFTLANGDLLLIPADVMVEVVPAFRFTNTHTLPGICVVGATSTSMVDDYTASIQSAAKRVDDAREEQRGRHEGR